MPPKADTYGAEISADGVYRWKLWRTWGAPSDPVLPICMLNGSTATPQVNDQTVRKCMGFGTILGYGGIVIGNQYGLRSRDPKALDTHPDPVGPENDVYLAALAQQAFITDVPLIVAWGGSKWAKRRADAVMQIFAREGAITYCFGINSDGSPLHPCFAPYLKPGDALQRWPA